jgi:hypothetical protein
MRTYAWKTGITEILRGVVGETLFVELALEEL